MRQTPFVKMFETGDDTLSGVPGEVWHVNKSEERSRELDGLCCEINRLLHNLIRSPKVEIPT
jgi:hypothetical protein